MRASFTGEQALQQLHGDADEEGQDGRRAQHLVLEGLQLGHGGAVRAGERRVIVLQPPAQEGDVLQQLVELGAVLRAGVPQVLHAGLQFADEQAVVGCHQTALIVQ